MSTRVVMLTSMLVGPNLEMRSVSTVDFRETKKLPVHIRYGCRRNRQLSDGLSLPVKNWVRRIAAV